MTSPTLVSVVILNWNGGHALQDAVASVLHQTHERVELVVVDNGSTDGSLESLPTDPRLRLIRNNENLGFARGMNVGWQDVRGDVWIPMNDDALLHPSFVEEALRVLADAPDTGAVAPLVLRMVDRVAPWRGPGPAVLASGPEAVTLDMRVVADADVDRARPTFKANGACPVYRVAAIRQLLDQAGEGPFDPWFDTYGEDLDLCFRLHALGWSVRYSPAVLAAHQVARSSAALIRDKRGRVRRNVMASRHANAWRHLPARKLVVAAPLIAAGDLAFVLLALMRGDPAALADLGAVWRRVARSIPSFVRERRRFPPRPHPDAGQLRWASRRTVTLDLRQLPAAPHGLPAPEPEQPGRAS